MAKMRKFLFWNESGDEKEKEALSLKKAVMSVQGDYKDKMISVEYITKKGKKIAQSVKIPITNNVIVIYSYIFFIVFSFIFVVITRPIYHRFAMKSSEKSIFFDFF